MPENEEKRGKESPVEPIQKAPGMTVKYRAVDPNEQPKRAIKEAHEDGGDGRIEATKNNSSK